MAARSGTPNTVGAVVRAAVRGTIPLPPIDKLRSVGEVLAAHEEHRNRYRSLQLAESWLALGQIVGHDQLEQQQLRKFPTVLERLTAHTLKAAPTLPACHLPRTAIGMARLQRVADNALWRPSAALWSSYAAQGSNPGLADPSHPCAQRAGTPRTSQSLAHHRGRVRVGFGFGLGLGLGLG